MNGRIAKKLFIFNLFLLLPPAIFFSFFKIDTASAAGSPSYHQRHFRIYKDDAGLNAATPYADEDTNYNVTAGVNFRLRIETTNEGTATGSTVRLLQFREDGGALTNVTTDSNNVRIVNSTNFTDGDATTTRLTAYGGKTFVAGQGKDAGNPTSSVSLSTSQYTEDEWSLKFETAAIGHTYQFGHDDIIFTWDVTPVITPVSPAVAPVITSGPSDGGSSAATPTPAGSNVVFTATATHAGGNNYYLALCKTDAITPNASAAPTCTGDSWCVSSSTTQGTEATCNYTTTAANRGNNAWFAFVCDHSAGSLCSASSQGTGNTGSPFVVSIPGETDPSPISQSSIASFANPFGPYIPSLWKEYLEKIFGTTTVNSNTTDTQSATPTEGTANNQTTIAPIGTPTLIPPAIKFGHDILSLYKVDPDVKYLQEFLNINNYAVSLTGPGSKGHETNIFGPLTKKALLRFQEAYSNDILKPLGYTKGTGLLGPSTRNFLNNLTQGLTSSLTENILK